MTDDDRKKGYTIDKTTQKVVVTEIMLCFMRNKVPGDEAVNLLGATMCTLLDKIEASEEQAKELLQEMLKRYCETQRDKQ